MELSFWQRERLLDPTARMSEVLFGLIMALTFTTTLELTAGRDDVRTLLVGRHWLQYRLGTCRRRDVPHRVADPARQRAAHDSRRAIGAGREDAHRVITGAMAPILATILVSDDIERVRQRLVSMPEVDPPTLRRGDWLRALAIFLLVFLSTFPVVVPFLFVADVRLAVRLSNLVAIVMLFGVGYSLAKHAGFNPWWTGAGLVVLGVALVVITVALGG